MLKFISKTFIYKAVRPECFAKQLVAKQNVSKGLTERHKFKFINKIKSYLIHYIQAQLIVTIVSLPILINWGLPLSKASVIGNLIFAPILTIFLILSSLIFFTELFCLPNNFLINLLNILTNFWQKILVCGHKSWLVGFTKTHILIMLCIPVIAFLVISRPQINTIKKRIFVLSVILISSLFYFSFQAKLENNVPKTLCFENKLKIIKDKEGKINLIDSGFFNRKQSPEKFVEFELRPYFLKNFGSLDIKNVTIQTPTSRNFKAATELCQTFNIEQLTLTLFNKKLSKFEWRNFFNLKRMLEKNDIIFKRPKGFIPSPKADL